MRASCRSRFVIMGVLLACAGSLSRAASAEDETSKVTARLEWARDNESESCISETELTRAIERRWDRKVFDDTANPDILVTGHVGRGEINREWVANIHLKASDGTPLGSRDLRTEADHCSALDDSLALAVGLMLDVSKEKVQELRARPPVAEETQSGDEPKPRVETPPKKPDGSPPPIRVPPNTYAPRAPWAVRPEAGVTASVGMLPQVGLAVEAAVTVIAPSLFPVSVRGSIWFDQDRRIDEGGSSFSMLTADVEVCPLRTSGKTHLLGCVLQRVGTVRSEGFEFDRNASNRNLVFDVGARARAFVPIAGPLSATLAIGIEFPLARYRFYYRGTDDSEHPVFTASPIIGTASAALALEL